MLCSALWLGSISSRYRGTPPVTERILSFSLAVARFPRQKALHSGNASGSSERLREHRPTNPGLARMLRSIHDDTEPQSTTISLECWESSVSQADFRWPAKSRSPIDIHEISSRST